MTDAEQLAAIEALEQMYRERVLYYQEQTDQWDAPELYVLRRELFESVPFLLAQLREARAAQVALEVFEVRRAEYGDGGDTVGIYATLEAAEAVVHAVALKYNATAEEHALMTEGRTQDGRVGYSDSQWNHRVVVVVHQVIGAQGSDEQVAAVVQGRAGEGGA